MYEMNSNSLEQFKELTDIGDVQNDRKGEITFKLDLGRHT